MIANAQLYFCITFLVSVIQCTLKFIEQAELMKNDRLCTEILFFQIEGAFAQGVGFFMLEEFLINADGLAISDGTWTYKIPAIDNIPMQLNVEVVNSGHHDKRVLSSKGISSNFSTTSELRSNIIDFYKYCGLWCFPVSHAG